MRLAEQLEDKQNSLQKQINAQYWSGRCSLEQAKKAKGKESEQLFGQAVEHFQQLLEFAEQQEDKQNSLQQQINAQSWLGGCYFEQAMKAKGKESEQLFGQAVEHFQQLLEFAEQQEDKQNSLQQQINAQSWLGGCYFEQAMKAKGKESEKLLGQAFEHFKADDNDPVDGNKVSLMRIGSSTYMNDPTEGEGLLELLNLQDLELENKADSPVHNAFFTCFSSRVNDLNQFRLYGKENGVEASGCCLVFNQNGDWLKEPDVSSSFRSFTNEQNEGFKEPIEADVAGLEDENLPLYQVAYIAYYDEYIAKEKCTIWLPDARRPKFGIRLKPVGKNLKWHKFRIKELKAALWKLMNLSKIKDEDKKALEYIRYLFKDFAFRDEEEFRLLKIEQIGSDKIKYCQTTKSVYLPYADIRNIVDEVILGTNYEKSGKERKAEVFQHLMRKYYPNVKVSRSSLPINANPPIKKD